MATCPTHSGRSTSGLRHALAYRNRGWSVVPVHSLVSGGCSCRHPDRDAPRERIPWDRWMSDRADRSQIGAEGLFPKGMGEPERGRRATHLVHRRRGAGSLLDVG
jgi:hypothetical protein